MYEADEDKAKEYYRSLDLTIRGVDNDVKIIKNWMKSQPHLPEIMEDVQIRNFLNLNKFSIEKTKEKIDMYYTIRTVVPDLFQDNNPKLPHMKRLFDTMYCCTHPQTIDGVSRVYFMKPKKPNVLAPREIIMMCFNIFELRLRQDFMVNDIFIIDGTHLTFNAVSKITPSLLAKAVAVYQKVYSLRLKAAYYVNSPSYLSILLKILKSLLKPKIFQRIQVHQDDEVLKQIFSREALPKDYGGEGPSLDELNEMAKEKLSEYQARFDELDGLRVEESLRPERLNNDEILGFYGNFKKLDVD